jgi:hypothetical protein
MQEWLNTWISIGNHSSTVYQLSFAALSMGIEVIAEVYYTAQHRMPLKSTPLNASS